jgi:hypothetical protein
MPRKKRTDLVKQSTDLIHINLRMREDLRQQLENAAKQHNATLSNEIRWRLEDSFKRDTLRKLEDITYDMQVCWARFSARFTRLDLEQALVEELKRAEDLAKIKTLAKLWIDHGAEEQHQPRGGV